MANIDLKATLVDAEDKVITEAEKPVETVTLLKRALLADVEHDGSAVKDKLERFELFMKLKLHNFESAVINLETAEVALLERAVKVFPTLITGQLTYLLTGKSTTKV